MFFCVDFGTDAIAETKLMADDPNKRVDAHYLGAWSSASDVDTFLSRFNHENNYDDGTTKLNLGDTIDIINGTYNGAWIIAGFDCEHNRTVTGNVTYDNGYGIMLVPYYTVGWGSCYWNSDNTVSGGYMNSLLHSKINEIGIRFKNGIFGTHIVNRNVLLSSSVNSSGSSDAYTWTTAYSPCVSSTQLTGILNSSFNEYDNGEANYKLPISNYRRLVPEGYDYWLRNIAQKINSDYTSWYIESNTFNIRLAIVNSTSKYLKPLIYIR